jgi:uncharacterized integral membrane protein
LSPTSQSGGVSLLRKIVAALILVPLAIVLIAFAVANRQFVTVSLDPFSAEHPAATVTRPLFEVIIGLLIVGVIAGGVAAWLRQSKWRRQARRLEREVSDLRGEIAALKRTGAPAYVPPTVQPPERLKIKPPVR